MQSAGPDWGATERAVCRAWMGAASGGASHPAVLSLEVAGGLPRKLALFSGPTEIT